MNKLLRFAIAFEKARAFLFIYVILVRSMYGDWWGEKKAFSHTAQQHAAVRVGKVAAGSSSQQRRNPSVSRSGAITEGSRHASSSRLRYTSKEVYTNQ